MPARVFRVTSLAIVGLLAACGCNRPKKDSQLEAIPDQSHAIELLRDAYAAFNRGDIDGAVKSLDENIEWSEPVEFPGGGTYHGREGAKKYLAQSRAAWAEVISEPERFITSGDRVVVFVHARVRPHGGGDWQEVRLADVYTFRDGKAVRMQAFAGREEALRAVGINNTTP